MVKHSEFKTQEFLGWVFGLTEMHFDRVMDSIGHVDSQYQAEKWNE